jgi:HEAT repeat protein
MIERPTAGGARGKKAQPAATIPAGNAPATTPATTPAPASNTESSSTAGTSGKPMSYFQFKKYSKSLATKGLDKPKLADERRGTLEEIIKFADERVPGMVLTALSDEWVVVRETAARLLVKYPSEDAIAALNEKLLADDSSDVRRACGMALASLGAAQAVLPLLHAGLDNPQQRVWTIDALSRMGKPAVQALVKCLTHDDPGLRMDAAIVLGRIGDPTASAPLLKLLRDPNGVLRANVVQAIGQIGVVDHCESVAQMLDDDDPGVRLNAAAALAKMGDQRVRQDVVGLLRDPDPTIRGFGATACARAGATTSWGAIAQLLGEENEEVRARAAEALGALGEPAAAKVLMTALKDSSVKVRMNATTGMGLLNCPAAVEGLAVASEDLQPLVRKRSLDSLAQIGTPDAREIIARVLRGDAVPDVRQTAARVLAQFPDASTVLLLKEALNDEFMVRVRACISIGEIGLPECVDILLPLLKDPVSEIRFHAANGLAGSGDGRAIKPLEELIEDTDPLVLRGVGKALTSLGDPRGEQVLKRAAELSAEAAAARAPAKSPGERDTGKGKKKETRKAAKSSGPKRSPLEIVYGLLGMLVPNSLMGMVSGALSWRPEAGSTDPQTLYKQIGAVAGVIALLGGGYWYFFTSNDAENAFALMQRGDYVSAGFLSPERVACCMSRGRREVWSTSGSMESSQDEQAVYSTFFASPDGKFVAALPKEGNDIAVLNAADFAEVGKLSGHPGKPTGGVYSADGSRFVTFDMSGGVFVWSVADKSASAKITITAPSPISAISAAASGTIAAAGTSDGKVLVRKLPDGSEFATIPAHTKAVNAIAFNEAGDRMITVGVEGTTHLWNLTTRKREKTINPKDLRIAGVTGLRFLKDGKRVLAYGGQYGIIDFEAAKMMPFVSSLENGISFLTMSADESAAVGGNGTDLKFEVYDATTGQSVKQIGPSG